MVMPDKYGPERRAAIMTIVTKHIVQDQIELLRRLDEGGWNITPATVSRDLAKLGIGRVPWRLGDQRGYRYVVFKQEEMS